MKPLAALLVSLALLFAGLPFASAGEFHRIETKSPVASVVATVVGAFVTYGDGSSSMLDACAAKIICLTSEHVGGLPPKAPAGGLPDGRVALAGKGDIRRAWYARPTSRYDHGVLGDKTEAGALIAEDASGRQFEHVLPKTHVFEDITPRIADLDGDGRNEIITIRSSLTKGAAVAAFGLRDGKLALLDTTREIGRTHRWLNIAGIGDYTGAGVQVIAWVETPHIGGTLKMANFEGGKLATFANTYPGFSNHFIGSREQGMSATGDFTGDGVDDLVLPSADRKSLVIAARTGFETIAAPGRISHAIIVVDGVIVTATDKGQLLALVP